MASRNPSATRRGRALALGAAVGVLGAVLSMVPAVLELDESAGLQVLFGLRGPQPAPADVVVVSISRDSAAAVGQTAELDEWRRNVHARLIESLASAGAAVIAFDVFFVEARDPAEDDERLAAAIGSAGNVLLAEKVVNAEGDGRRVDLAPVLPRFADAALGTAPFTLPRVPFRVAQFWTFGHGADDVPSLPVLAVQAFLLRSYDDLLSLLRDVRPAVAAELPPSAAKLAAGRELHAHMRKLRAAFRADSRLAADLGARARARGSDSAGVMRLIELYGGGSSRYLNYVGPPGSIRTLPYDRVIENAADLGVAGKVLFVGFAETRQSEERDWFNSVFSQRTGGVLAGVEIGATAFANLLEGRSVRPLGMPAHLLLVLGWGVLLGTLLGVLPLGRGVAVALAAGVAYVLLAYERFADAQLWLPLLVPIVAQLPVALAAAFFWKYGELRRQRERVQTVLGYYVPPAVVTKLAHESNGLDSSKQLVHGTCLFTDAEEYTTVSEALHPEDLRKLMNEYYEVMFDVVSRHGGHVSDTAGDSMVAVWTTAEPSSHSRSTACRAGLEILDAVERFNRNRGRQQLPTRVGLESGELLLGNIGAAQHFEYRAIGDIVNTASRLQALNRLLATRVLVSEATVADTGVPARDLGVFLLRGKTTPLRVFEPLAACRSGADPTLIEPFGAAMQCVERQEWSDARRYLAAAAEAHPDDGPTSFYLTLITQYERQPPAWRGYVSVSVK